MKQWLISAVPRAGFDGFRRAGVFFPAFPDGVLLPDDRITPDIRDEPMLIITQQPDEERKTKT